MWRIPLEEGAIERAIAQTEKSISAAKEELWRNERRRLELKKYISNGESDLVEFRKALSLLKDAEEHERFMEREEW